MEIGEDRSDLEKEGEEQEEEEEDSVFDLLRDRFRLSAISIAEAEAKRNGMEISEPIVACIADLAFKYTGQLAKDLELFAQHAGRKSVKMEDVIVSAHRNEHLAAVLMSFRNKLKAKEPQSERKRKKGSRKEDKATDSVVHVPDA
ncbi:PREDICTED: MHF histone-fold complex subunit 1 [Theobroma cacao]|uniref:MHF histone-fold complex subunit 1 n=1 Tax=Theobroma cacao TaxID=3641 RepID=A0AB32VAQ2_THECC|nr:PREDICTED: MHF histone-fold complex subunit 1 [Theobroma cacao]